MSKIKTYKLIELKIENCITKEDFKIVDILIIDFFKVYQDTGQMLQLTELQINAYMRTGLD